MILRILALLALAIFLVLGASVGYFNAQTVEFDYLAGKIELPLIALVIGEFVLAVLLTLLICMGRMLALKNEVRRLRKQILNTDAELKALRELPLKDA
ncbi:LapA family protein [Panacagrimonas sp.]|uniref:LapA family protein n=1 Tax=Panacagrimonas sp. TaxID=2480088 RepID=UPI003B515A6D